MTKKLVAMLTLLVLLVGIASTSFAITMPHANLLNECKNQTVKPGKAITFTFKLDCGSFKKKNDTLRAKLVANVEKDSKVIGTASWLWTGKQNYTLRVKMKPTAVEGKYYLKFRTYYRKTASSSWKRVKTGSAKFFVKK